MNKIITQTTVSVIMKKTMIRLRKIKRIQTHLLFEEEEGGEVKRRK
jgi:hypothetical protein